MPELFKSIAQVNSPTIVTEVRFDTGSASYLDFPIDWDRIVQDAKDRGEAIRGVSLHDKQGD